MKRKIKPRIGYFKHFDPTLNYDWVNKMVDINVITTKVITNEFINVCIKNKDKIFIHFVCNGTGETMFEPNIPNLKKSFFSLKALVDAGFPQKQILVIIKPIIQNDNGLNSIKLMMQLFSRFKELRLRYVRFELLKHYKFIEPKKPKFTSKNIVKSITRPETFIKRGSNNITYKIQNRHISKRLDNSTVLKSRTQHKLDFFQNYKQLIAKYRAIITVDDNKEPIIGNRELIPFGYVNNIKNSLNLPDRIIKYKQNGQTKEPIIDVLLSKTQQIRCQNKCVLCPYQ